MATQNEKILTAVLIATIITASVVIVIVSQTVTARGRIVTTGMDVYSDEACTVHVTEIDWGDLEPGAVKATYFWAKNTGGTNITLNFNSTDWDPPVAAHYISYSWNYDNRTLVSGEKFNVQMTISISPEVTGITTFRNSINIQGIKT
jgi:hypothetical protein